MEEYISSRIKDRVQALSKDEHSGAMDIALEAADIVRESISALIGMDLEIILKTGKQLIKNLKNLRPSMAPLYNLMEQIEVIFDYYINENQDSLAELIRSMDKHVLFVKQMNYKAILNAVSLIQPECKILTHSTSSTIISIFRLNQHKDIEIYITESRPLREGTRTARILSQMGYRVTIITDMEAGLFMPEIDFVLVGADATLADGTVINKMGTYMLALAAKDHNKPFYVVCDNLKKLPHNDITLEEMPHTQIFTNIDSEKIRVRNIYYDMTPARLITNVINEEWENEETVLKNPANSKND